MIGAMMRLVIVPAVAAMAAMSMILTASALPNDGPQTLVVGTISPNNYGQVVTVWQSALMCTTVSGGIVAADGTYGVVVSNCLAKPTTLQVNGQATTASFVMMPGATNLVNASVVPPAVSTGASTIAPETPVALPEVIVTGQAAPTSAAAPAAPAAPASTSSAATAAPAPPSAGNSLVVAGSDRSTRLAEGLGFGLAAVGLASASLVFNRKKATLAS